MSGPSELKNIPFPDCYNHCINVGQFLGVSECKNICPFKFNEKKKEIKNFSNE